MSEAQRSKKVTGVSKVSRVSRVSEVSKMLKQGEQQSLHSLLSLGEGGRRPDEGADVVRSYTLETAKGGQQSLHSFAPWGEGQDEGSYKFDTADMTPHQGRPACTNTLETAKEVRSTSSLAVLSRKGRGMFYRQCENFLIALFL